MAAKATYEKWSGEGNRVMGFVYKSRGFGGSQWKKLILLASRKVSG